MKAHKKCTKYWNIEQNDDPYTVRTVWAIIGILVTLGVYGLMYLNFIALPTLKTGQVPSEFNGYHAYDMLKNLTNLGPKVCGSEVNERLAVNMILTEIENISTEFNLDLLDPNTVQISSGGYTYGGRRLCVYHELKNLVVRISPKNKPLPGTSVLINSHYDSVPSSSGGGDAGSMIAVMLGVLRAIASHTEDLNHSIIFLFNGCEEKQLAGSHAFITQHEWASTVRAVINLDAAGSGSKEIMFQTSPRHAWLLNYYQSAPHPFAQAMGEEIFQWGLIPSVTDYQIFTTYGNIIGMDFAYALNGYVYHTSYDTASIISPETIQNTGDNILAIALGLANATELYDVEAYASDEKMVFFDYNGWFMVSYTETTGTVINIVIEVIALFSIGLTLFDLKKLHFYSWCGILCKFGAVFGINLLTFSVASGLIVALVDLVYAMNTTMIWFGQPVFIFGQYFCLFFSVGAFGPALYIILQKKRSPVEGNCFLVSRLFMTAQSGLILIILVAMTRLRIRSAYIILIGLFFYTISSVITTILSLSRPHDHLKTKNYIWLTTHCIFQLFAFMFYASISLTVFGVFIPISGRTAPDDNPELMIGIFSIMMGLLLGGFLTPLVTIFKGPKKIGLIFLVVFVVHFLLLFALFPYKEATAAQRLTVFHKSRAYHTSGTLWQAKPLYLISVEDSNGLQNVRNFLAEQHPSSLVFGSVTDVCSDQLNCQLPYLVSYSFNQFSTLVYAPDEPNLRLATSLTSIAVPENISSSLTLYQFELTGPNVITIDILTPSKRIVDWSFAEDVGQSIFGDHYLYQIDLFKSTDAPYLFNLTLNGTYNPNERHSMEIGIGGCYDHTHNFSENFQLFVDSFPKWMHVDPQVVSYISYEF